MNISFTIFALCLPLTHAADMESQDPQPCQLCEQSSLAFIRFCNRRIQALTNENLVPIIRSRYETDDAVKRYTNVFKEKFIPAMEKAHASAIVWGYLNTTPKPVVAELKKFLLVDKNVVPWVNNRYVTQPTAQVILMQKELKHDFDLKLSIAHAHHLANTVKARFGKDWNWNDDYQTRIQVPITLCYDIRIHDPTLQDDMKNFFKGRSIEISVQNVPENTYLTVTSTRKFHTRKIIIASALASVIYNLAGARIAGITKKQLWRMFAYYGPTCPALCLLITFFVKRSTRRESFLQVHN